METLLTVIFLSAVGIPTLILCVGLAISLSKNVVDGVDFLMQGPPEGLVLTKRPKGDSGEKQTPIDVVYAHPGSMF